MVLNLHILGQTSRGFLKTSINLVNSQLGAQVGFTSSFFNVKKKMTDNINKLIPKIKNIFDFFILPTSSSHKPSGH